MWSAGAPVRYRVEIGIFCAALNEAHLAVAESHEFTDRDEWNSEFACYTLTDRLSGAVPTARLEVDDESWPSCWVNEL